jgi:hypothetical protein
MVNPAWLEALREKLAHQGLPPQYIERLVQELRDHYTDLIDEGTSMEPEKISAADERMGHPTHLAEVAADEYRKRHFSMSRRGYAIFGWVLIVSAILAGLGTVPTKYSSGIAKNGAVSGHSGLFETKVEFEATAEGKGNFTYFYCVY